MKCLLVDPENPEVTGGELGQAIATAFPEARMAVTSAKLQVDYYSCSTFLIAAFKAYALRGKELLDKLFAQHSESEQRFTVPLHETPVLLLRMAQKVNFSELPPSLLNEPASYKKPLTLAAYISKHTVTLDQKAYNATALRKKYRLLSRLETILNPFFLIPSTNQRILVWQL